MDAQQAAEVLQKERNDREQAVIAGLKELLEKHRCDLRFVQQVVNGIPQVGQFVAVAL